MSAAAARRASSSPARAVPAWVLISLLVPASVLGTLTRVGLQHLFDYNGATVNPSVLWAQLVGCAVFGGLLQNKACFDALAWRPSLSKARRSRDADADDRGEAIEVGTALYTALTSGYCGSVTTFSTWILDIFLAWANYDDAPRSGGQSFLTGLTQTMVTLLLSFAAFLLGMKLAEDGELFSLAWVIKRLPASLTKRPANEDDVVLDAQGPDALDGHSANGVASNQDETHKRNTRVVPELVYIATAGFAIGIILMLSLLAAFYTPTRTLSLALVFSPPGAILRWYLSRFNGRRLSTQSRTLPYGATGFPWGTLAANLVGVVVLCATWSSLHVSTSPATDPSTSSRSKLVCDIVGPGLETGFSGALSTISTFVAELWTLGAGLNTRRAAVWYAHVSWGFSLLLTVFLIAIPTASLHYVDRCPQ